MTPVAIRVLRDRKAAAPEAANGRVKAIRQVFRYGLEEHSEHVRSNPARDVRYFKTGSQGHHTWTVEEVVQFRARYPVGTKAWLALALLLFAGGRRADVTTLGRQHIRRETLLDGTVTKRLRYTQNKNRKVKPVTLEIPLLPMLEEAIDAVPGARERLTFLVTEFGKPFTSAGFGNWFRDRCVEAGVPGRAHGLRKAGATLAAENGATEPQLMAMFGWRTNKQAAHYTKNARQKKLADAGMHLISLGENANAKCPTFDSGGTSEAKN
jgi:integrase